MKVCIQDIATHEYFQGPFQWVKDSSAAFNFVSSLEAIDFCARMGRRQVQVLLSYGDPQKDVCLFSLEAAV